MRSVRFFVAVILACLLGMPSMVNASVADVQAFVEREAIEASVPGVSYALIDGDVIQTGSFGLTKGRDGSPVSEQTVFAIGSISKSFTAVAIMQLREDGLLELDKPISAYLPGLDGTAIGPLTIGQLLSHTSGLSTEQGNRDQTDISSDEDALKRRVAYLSTVVPEVAPGTAWVYSNANYQLLSRVVEVLGRTEFGDYVEAQILQPLGMDDSRMVDWKTGQNVAVGHRPWFWTKIQYDGRGTGRGSFGQGGVMASARDMAKYLTMMMNGENDIITADSKAEMMQPFGPVSPNYGLGWFVAPEHGQIFHSGANPGFEALATMRPGQKKAFVILTNGGSGFGFGQTGYFRRGASVMALGGPEESRPGWTMKGVFILLAAMPIVCLLGAWNTWKRRDMIRKKGSGVAHAGVWLPLLLAAGFSYILLVLVPGSFGVNIQTATFFQPDVGLLLILTAASATIWASLRAFAAIRPVS